MSNKRPQPYWAHVLERFPKDENLLKAIGDYLEMRIQKNNALPVGEWDACLDEVLNVYDIADPNKSAQRIRKVSKKSTLSIPELTYLFLTATARKWNHIVFTREQDRMYSNMSYYQDPYWNDMKNNPKTLAILREELKGVE